MLSREWRCSWSSADRRAPTTSEWSTILLPARVRLKLEVLHICHSNIHSSCMKYVYSVIFIMPHMIGMFDMLYDYSRDIGCDRLGCFFVRFAGRKLGSLCHRRSSEGDGLCASLILEVLRYMSFKHTFIVYEIRAFRYIYHATHDRHVWHVVIWFLQRYRMWQTRMLLCQISRPNIRFVMS